MRLYIEAPRPLTRYFNNAEAKWLFLFAVPRYSTISRIRLYIEAHMPLTLLCILEAKNTFCAVFAEIISSFFCISLLQSLGQPKPVAPCRPTNKLQNALTQFLHFL